MEIYNTNNPYFLKNSSDLSYTNLAYQLINPKDNIKRLSQFRYNFDDSIKGEFQGGFTYIFDKDKRIVEEWLNVGDSSNNHKTYFISYFDKKKHKEIWRNGKKEYFYDENGVLIKESKKTKYKSSVKELKVIKIGDTTRTTDDNHHYYYIAGRPIKFTHLRIDFQRLFVYYSDNKLKSYSEYKDGKLYAQRLYNTSGELVSQRPGFPINYVREFRNNLYYRAVQKTESDSNITTYKYNKDHMIIGIHVSEASGFSSTYSCIYNEHYDIVQVLQNGREKEQYKYEYDSKGNWIKRAMFIDNEPGFIYERIIEYYD